MGKKKEKKKIVKTMKIRFELNKFFLQSFYIFFFLYKSEEIENIDLSRKIFKI